MTLARYLSHFDASVQEAGRAVAVAGGLAGGCLLLLRLSGLWLGYSETRDLLQYLLIGGWMGLGLGAALARLPLPHAALAAGAVLALYACGEISVYAAHVLAQGWLWPVWLMLLGVAFLPEHPRSTPAYRVAAAWLVAAMLGASLQLLSPLQKLAVPLELRQLPLALPFLLGLVYILCALLWPCGLLKPMRRHGAYAMGHALALWVLALLAFHLEPGAHSIMMHHWKAFVESANMVRAGGWLLWDVPSQYGFLQTWLLAALPGDTVWQNFYVLLGGLQLAVGYAVFALLWWSYRGLTGFVFALSMAVASGADAASHAFDHDCA